MVASTSSSRYLLRAGKVNPATVLMATSTRPSPISQRRGLTSGQMVGQSLRRSTFFFGVSLPPLEPSPRPRSACIAIPPLRMLGMG